MDLQPMEGVQANGGIGTVRHHEAIGLIAGWGSFPILVAQKCRDLGIPVSVAALKHHADPSLETIAHRLKWFGVCRLGGQLKYFRDQKIKRVVLAGKLFKDRILYNGAGWLAHSPDLTCIRTLYTSFISHRDNTTDDTVLGAIVNLYSRHGIKILSITESAPELLAEEGCLTSSRPTAREMRDVRCGWMAAKNLGQLDIGQSVTVRDQTILAVEAVEGTDGLIRRTGEICPRGRFTLVKVAKPQQDMRFDVPTIGVRTIQNMVRSGGRIIAIEAGKTIIVDRAQTIELANQNGIAIVSLVGEKIAGQPFSKSA